MELCHNMIWFAFTFTTTHIKATCFYTDGVGECKYVDLSLIMVWTELVGNISETYLTMNCKHNTLGSMWCLPNVVLFTFWTLSGVAVPTSWSYFAATSTVVTAQDVHDSKACNLSSENTTGSVWLPEWWWNSNKCRFNAKERSRRLGVVYKDMRVIATWINLLSKKSAEILSKSLKETNINSTTQPGRCVYAA